MKLQAVELCAPLKEIRRRVKIGTDLNIPRSLTTKQAAVLLYCRQSVMLHGKMPTVREVQSQFELSSLSTAQFHLSNLRGLGLLPTKRADLYITLNEGQMLLDLLDAKERA